MVHIDVSSLDRSTWTDIIGIIEDITGLPEQALLALTVSIRRILLAITILFEQVWLLLMSSLGQTTLTLTCSLTSLFLRILIARIDFLPQTLL